MRIKTNAPVVPFLACQAGKCMRFWGLEGVGKRRGIFQKNDKKTQVDNPLVLRGNDARVLPRRKMHFFPCEALRERAESRMKGFGGKLQKYPAQADTLPVLRVDRVRPPVDQANVVVPPLRGKIWGSDSRVGGSRF